MKIKEGVFKDVDPFTKIEMALSLFDVVGFVIPDSYFGFMFPVKLKIHNVHLLSEAGETVFVRRREDSSLSISKWRNPESIYSPMIYEYFKSIGQTYVGIEL